MALFNLQKCKGLTVDGKGSTFILGTDKPYSYLSGTKECVIENCTFRYAQNPAFSATCNSVNAEEGWAEMTADRDIGLATAETYAPPEGTTYFGVLNRSDSRYHLYIKKYEMINAGKRTFKIYFDMERDYPADWVKNYLSTYGMICPTPKIGHLTVETAFSAVGNTNLTLSNININSCYKFGMFIGNNEGTLKLDNVNFVPADGEINFTGWRDAFHVKDNRCKILWSDCIAKGNYDDAINISSSALKVTEYNAETKEISLVWNERTNGIYYEIKPGDTLNVIDTSTGVDCGTAEVENVIKQSDGVNRVVLKSSLKNISSLDNLIAYFTNRCAPDSVIDNCDFSGTFRFRGPLTVENTKIFNMRTWIDIEGKIEGPVPQNISFKNCDIQAGSGSTIIINSYNNTNGYGVKNITFENCIFEDSTLSIGKNDKVRIISCKRHDGSSIANR